jgi:hypothetical protein
LVVFVVFILIILVLFFFFVVVFFFFPFVAALFTAGVSLLVSVRGPALLRRRRRGAADRPVPPAGRRRRMLLLLLLPRSFRRPRRLLALEEGRAGLLGVVQGLAEHVVSFLAGRRRFRAGEFVLRQVMVVIIGASS